MRGRLPQVTQAEFCLTAHLLLAARCSGIKQISLHDTQGGQDSVGRVGPHPRWPSSVKLTGLFWTGPEKAAPGHGVSLHLSTRIPRSEGTSRGTQRHQDWVPRAEMSGMRAKKVGPVPRGG